MHRLIVLAFVATLLAGVVGCGGDAKTTPPPKDIGYVPPDDIDAGGDPKLPKTTPIKKRK